MLQWFEDQVLSFYEAVTPEWVWEVAEETRDAFMMNCEGCDRKIWESHPGVNDETFCVNCQKRQRDEAMQRAGSLEHLQVTSGWSRFP